MTRPEHDGFIELLPLYGEMLDRVGRQVRNRAEARDIVQEAYKRAVEHRVALQGHPNPSAWLMQVVKNLVVDWARAKARYPTGAPEPDTLPAPEGPAVWQRIPPEALAEAIRQLEPEPRAVVQMRLEGMTFQEIGGARGFSTATAFRRFGEAVQNLEMAIVRLQAADD